MNIIPYSLSPNSIFTYIIDEGSTSMEIYFKLFSLYSLGSIFLYNLLSYLDYAFLYNDEYKDERRLESIKREIKLNVINCISFSILCIPWIYIAHMTKCSKVFYNIYEYNISSQIFYIMVFICLSEFLIYWIHRLLHDIPFLYKNLHKPHHEFIYVDPFAAGAFHPLDAFLQGFPYFAIPIFVPLHQYFILASLLFVICWSVSIHDRYALVNWYILNGAKHHHYHHTKFNYNYGQVFTICDRIFGTYY
ncbi:Fatty acid hydroxylase (C-5 sterol desaturase putative) [Orpheovirus IHUMI-LCC2]|uniref:Fatty acid hydroxylase (C-5 sterol desaturase putative) n=1 Tax=Orpheovirus IHUMI-LCC2 TaxID=2023057 RepID=A0A2I2L655_9VIRU|nr:Fatty acid hydroxylase (C-5 sterol desaturase putative) [Orpheovirus IHUMI-LCC2]SNW63014.1 Fatty acid hydroxylase (C-5 sterol desaturase putative) [Orpheovirus IHUMI-LCC2]